ncbi:MAG: leucine-rich repeat protein, partial [Muribaculaceae bacterium]
DEESCMFDIDPWYWGHSSVTIITDNHVEYIYNEGYTYYGGPFFNRFSEAKGLDKITSLKISGDMYLQDFEVIQKCTNLVTADFSEAMMHNLSYNDYSLSFAGLEFLETVILPTNMPSIATDCFQGCTNLKSITIQSRVEGIEDHAFESFINLEEVDMSDAATTSIGDSTFLNCSSLKRVVLPSSINQIRKYAFAYCTSLEDITLPNSLRSVGLGAFEGCENLKRVQLSTGTSYINAKMFAGCSSLESLTIPATVTDVYSMPFYNCTKLKHIRLEATTPPQLYQNVFAGFDRSACTLSVPQSAVVTYQNTLEWRDFGSIEGF